MDLMVRCLVSVTRCDWLILGAPAENFSVPLCRELTIIVTVHTVAFMWAVKGKFNYAILVARRSEAGRRRATRWNLAYHALSSSLAGS